LPKLAALLAAVLSRLAGRRTRPLPPTRHAFRTRLDL
jgi:hypothetical protein